MYNINPENGYLYFFRDFSQQLMQYSGCDRYSDIGVWKKSQGPNAWFVQENFSISLLSSPTPDVVRTFKIESMALWMDVTEEAVY